MVENKNIRDTVISLISVNRSFYESLPIIGERLKNLSEFFKSNFKNVWTEIYKQYIIDKDNKYLSRILYILYYAMPINLYNKYFYYDPIISHGLSSGISSCQEPAIMIIENWKGKKCIDLLECAIANTVMSDMIKDYATKILKKLKEEHSNTK